ncbi:hypothetical protein TRAPUB_4359 [Trametes pubescens]|uniref:Uncharacterized protein n=1 Tax=Trametes pubescens TaxID=154538 RepID=A0A1M2VBH9_TRAPU|nr:hypothetical protein TRAPUB_4359 [Trametes pubescens]
MPSTPGPSRTSRREVEAETRTGDSSVDLAADEELANPHTVSHKASKILTVLMKQARDETNKNFRPPPDASSAGGGRKSNASGRGKASNTKGQDRHRESPASELHSPHKTTTKKQATEPSSRRANRFRVSKMVFLPYGLDYHTGELPEPWEKTPRKKKIQELQQFGLAVLDGGSDDDQIWLDANWTAFELFCFLKDKFPALFDYLSDHDPDLANFDATSSKSSYRLPYALLVSEDKKLAVVPGNRNPDGALCRFNKGRDSAGWRESNIYLVTRDAISPSEYTHWINLSQPPTSRVNSPSPSEHSHTTSLPPSEPEYSDAAHESDLDPEEVSWRKTSKAPIKVYSRRHLRSVTAPASAGSASCPSADRKGKGKAALTTINEEPDLPSRKRAYSEFACDLGELEDDSTDREIELGFDFNTWRSSEPPEVNRDEAGPPKRRRRVISPGSSRKPAGNSIVDIIDLTGDMEDRLPSSSTTAATAAATDLSQGGGSSILATPRRTRQIQDDTDALLGIMSSPAVGQDPEDIRNPWNAGRKPTLQLDF